MGIKRKARKLATSRMNKTARDTGEVVALLRALRERMGLIEELEPDSRMLREYRHMCGWCIIELRRIRALAELDLQRPDISRRERRIAAEHLDFVALVASEIEAEAGADTAH